MKMSFESYASREDNSDWLALHPRSGVTFGGGGGKGRVGVLEFQAKSFTPTTTLCVQNLFVGGKRFECLVIWVPLDIKLLASIPHATYPSIYLSAWLTPPFICLHSQKFQVSVPPCRGKSPGYMSLDDPQKHFFENKQKCTFRNYSILLNKIVF